MQPIERALQEELRREAAQVHIPDGMWGNISRQLDAERAATEHRRQQRNIFQRKSALALAAAAGIFWIMAMPVDMVTSQVESQQPLTVRTTSTGRQSENVPWEDIRKGPIPTRYDRSPNNFYLFDMQVTPR